MSLKQAWSTQRNVGYLGLHSEILSQENYIRRKNHSDSIYLFLKEFEEEWALILISAVSSTKVNKNGLGRHYCLESVIDGSVLLRTF